MLLQAADESRLNKLPLPARQDSSMEGNECYKFSTIQRYISKTSAAPIRKIIEIGANVGRVTREMQGYFPEAHIVAFEPVEHYFLQCRAATADLENVTIHHKAVTSQHLYHDDCGATPRNQPCRPRLLLGLPEAGGGWEGGSMLVPGDHPAATGSDAPFGYAKTKSDVEVLTLADAHALCGGGEIDLMKLDCEGCENHVLGCAEPDLLSMFRFMTGEYHNLQRFYQVMRGKLFHTHKVNLVGDAVMGAFFAERLEGTGDGILLYDKSGMLQSRPWLGPPIDWHIFDPAYVAEEERGFHGI